jgi:asparagine synthetase B (glutamine-hydrolysing)
MLVRLSGAELWEEWLPEDITPHARSVLQTVYHPAHPLRYECTNKLTALYGIESLQPFLDRELISFLANIPGTVHSRNGVPKAILRDSMTEWVPAAILQRQDKGDATAALETGIRGSWTAYAERIAGSTCAFDWHILERRRVQERLAKLERQRQIDSGAAAWELIELYALVVWVETFFGAGPGSVPRRSYERAQVDGS